MAHFLHSHQNFRFREQFCTQIFMVNLTSKLQRCWLNGESSDLGAFLTQIGMFQVGGTCIKIFLPPASVPLRCLLSQDFCVGNQTVDRKNKTVLQLYEYQNAKKWTGKMTTFTLKWTNHLNKYVKKFNIKIPVGVSSINTAI